MTPLQRANVSLEGLSVGDAFGERFFGATQEVLAKLEQRQLPSAPWNWTDDTAMAMSIAATLRKRGRIDQDVLARRFVAEFETRPARGYGRGARQLMEEIGRGTHWHQASRRLFNQQGSCGNGAAMRVAPLGAYFCDDLERVAREAELSAEVTHFHHEGKAGAVAVAIAAACSWQGASASEMLTNVLHHTPTGAVNDGIQKATQLDLGLSGSEAAQHLGSGQEVTAQDTVPYCLWCAARHWDNFEEAIWTTVSGLGDRDTTCAIVGGILAGRTTIPASWLELRESLPPF